MLLFCEVNVQLLIFISLLLNLDLNLLILNLSITAGIAGLLTGWPGTIRQIFTIRNAIVDQPYFSYS